MANTINNTKIIAGSKVRILYYTLVSDGTNETDAVVYDSSDYTGTDSQDAKIEKIFYSLSAAATARARLEFDATTDVLAIDLPPGQMEMMDFRDMGGLLNYAGSGKTGDILLTTTGLAAGDLFTLILWLKND